MTFVNSIAKFLLATADLRLLATENGWQQWGDYVRQKLGPSIKSLHRPFDEWLGGFSMSVAMYCAIGLFVLAGIWVWTLRREFIFRGAPSNHWWCDLRLWATLLLLPYIGVYMLMG